MRMRTLSTAVAALGLVLVAGCGSSADIAGGSGDDSGDSAKSSTSAPKDSGSDEGGDSGDGTTLTVANFADVVAGAQTDAKSVHMTMSMKAGGQAVEAEADVATDADPTKASMRMTMDMQGETVEMLMVDGTMYMTVPGIPAGKWMKIDLEDAPGAMGKSLAEMRGSMDPSQSIENLRGALEGLEDTGETETIDGVEAKRYDAVVDTSKLLSTAGLPAAAGAQIPAEITYQYWVGPDDLPRKIVIEGLAAEAGPVEMYFSKWGQEVSVTAPPASDVLDSSSMLGG